MSKTEYHVLIVDDDPDVLESLVLLLEDDYHILTASSGPEAIQSVKENDNIGVVVMDIKMAGMDGIEASREIKTLTSEIPIILNTGFPGEYSEEEIDREEKPFDYIQKGTASCKLTRAIKNAMNSYLLKINNTLEAYDPEILYGMIGQSSAMKDVFNTIRKVAPSDVKVMILGETGTGKELVARALYKHSNRSNEKLVIFNCNHRPPDLVESELFGHAKGSFTGATEDRVGLFEFANNGTIFLDEIGDLDITTQAKILRVLESGEFQTMGSTPELKKTNIRLFCATNHDLEQRVKESKFRQDLYFRLKGVVITLPALRERKEDIPLLIEKHTGRLTIEADQMPKVFDRSAVQALMEQDWPGNVRELLDTIESLIVLTDSSLIMADDVYDYFKQEKQEPSKARSLSELTKEFQRNKIISVLNDQNGNVNAAARELRHDPANLRKLIKRYNISNG